jgi:alpha-glucosidase (family GH31 glycosyl hydrolase)
MWLTWERRYKCTRSWWEVPRERNHLEDQGVDGIRIDLTEIGLGGVQWTQMPQDREWWLALVNTVMNLRVLVPRT